MLILMTGGFIGAVGTGKIVEKKMNAQKQLADKHLALFLMMNQWVKIKQEGKSPAIYFEQNGYKRIAIYGMSYVGETLIDELKNTDVQIIYGIDKKAENIFSEVDIFTLDDALEDVDAIIVTAITFLDEIQERLSKKITCPIISLQDILYEI